MSSSPGGAVARIDKARESLAEDPLHWHWASDLPDDPEPDEQLVEGVIGRMGLSVLYGDSNSGKTFLALDIANAIASGRKWMQRNTLAGLVVYLATESPRSIITRQQAYQKHWQRKVQCLAIVQSPINLYNGSADACEVVDLIRRLESECGEKCELVIGDTLSRMAAGANENSGEDMGTVIKHAEHIRREARAHMMLIHHSGKDQARGARGWSGLRAAIDTEIEVSADDATGDRAAEVTKQRDIPGKGERIGFRLEVVDLGPGQWDGRRTSCVVVAADAPAKQSKGKRVSEVAGAIKEALRGHGTGMRKSDLAKALEEHHGYRRTSTYKEIGKLVDAGQLNEAAGMVSLNKADLSNWVQQ